MYDPGRPAEAEYAPFYAGYVQRVEEGPIGALLEAQQRQVRALAQRVAPERETFRYAPGKWSLREVMAHLTDAERVFGYRAFAISRGETQPLPGFDENAYVARSGAEDHPLVALAEAFDASRRANRALFGLLDEAAWRRVGVANGQPVSVRALAYIAVGHVAHHLAVLQARYGVE